MFAGTIALSQSQTELLLPMAKNSFRHLSFLIGDFLLIPPFASKLNVNRHIRVAGFQLGDAGSPYVGRKLPPRADSWKSWLQDPAFWDAFNTAALRARELFLRIGQLT